MENIVLTQLSVPEVRQLFRQELEQYFTKNPLKIESKKLSENDPEQLLTKKEAAKLLSCATSTIDNYRRNGTIKRHYIGSSVRFKRGELLAAVNQMSTNKKSR